MDLMPGGAGQDQRYQLWLPGHRDGTICDSVSVETSKDRRHRCHSLTIGWKDTSVTILPEFELNPEEKQQKEREKEATLKSWVYAFHLNSFLKQILIVL